MCATIANRRRRYQCLVEGVENDVSPPHHRVTERFLVDSGRGVEAGGVPLERAAPGLPQPIEALQRREDRFDRRQAPRNKHVATCLPGWQRGHVFVPPMHDAVLDPGGLEPRPSRLLLVGLVAIDGPLVAADQPIGNLALVDLGQTQHQAMDQPGPLVNTHMRLVVQDGATLLPRPIRTRLAWVHSGAPVLSRIGARSMTTLMADIRGKVSTYLKRTGMTDRSVFPAAVRTTDRAPCTSRDLRCWLPRFEMPRSTVRWPLECWRGTSPTQAAR